MDPRRSICRSRPPEDLCDPRSESFVLFGALRLPSLQTCVIAAAGDFQDTAHCSDRLLGPVRAHELEEPLGTLLVSRANQAAAFLGFLALLSAAGSRASIARAPAAPASSSRLLAVL